MKAQDYSVGCRDETVMIYKRLSREWMLLRTIHEYGIYSVSHSDV